MSNHTTEDMKSMSFEDIEMGVKGGPTPMDMADQKIAVVPLVETQDVRDVGRKVRLVATYDLPAGYRLDVMVNKGRGAGFEYFAVKIPPEGALRGKVVVAKEIVAKPITGRWYDDIFVWPSKFNGQFCPIALFLPLTAAGILLHHLGRDCCGAQNSVSGSVMIGFLTVVNTILWFIPGGPPIIYVVVLVRLTTRQQYKIRGDFASDLIFGWFCSCCSLLQAYHRHMKMSGDEPDGYRSSHVRAKVVH